MESNGVTKRIQLVSRINVLYEYSLLVLIKYLERAGHRINDNGGISRP